ncbi:MAG: hypothetical protein OXD32_06165, partial [Endozoicomonadaceae bacterium]|nr:hypothetical protein [Endozoicomonadaceae bacterium]
KSVILQVKHYCVSLGQPFQNPDTIISVLAKKYETDVSSGKVEQREYQNLSIQAGRHGSKNTVSCLFGKGFEKQNFTYYKRPHKLNFAVTGTLTIDGVSFDDMVLAQGHTVFTNNWWFGGKHCRYLNKRHNIHAVNCTAADNKTTWCFFRGRINTKFKGGKYVNDTFPNEVRVWHKKCIIDDHW